MWFIRCEYPLNEIETDTDTTVEAKGVLTRNDMLRSKLRLKLFIN